MKMASSNKTPNLALSQFIGTDKPAWLADYNTDMLKIDAGVQAAKGDAQSASAAAEQAATKATAAQQAATGATSAAATATQNANDAKANSTNAVNAANLATQAANEAKSSAETAKNTADTASQAAAQVRGDLAKHEVAIKTWSSSPLVGNAAINQNYVYFRENLGIGLLQIDGLFAMVTPTQTGDVVIGTMPLDVERPAEDAVYRGAIHWAGNNTTTWGTLTLTTTGQVKVASYVAGMSYGYISTLVPYPQGR